MDIVIDELIIEEDRAEHIARHNVSVDEVLKLYLGIMLPIAVRRVRF